MIANPVITRDVLRLALAPRIVVTVPLRSTDEANDDPHAVRFVSIARPVHAVRYYAINPS